MLCYVTLRYVALCYVMLCCVMLCYVNLCYVMLCYVMICCVMLCYVMLCYVMLRLIWNVGLPLQLFVLNGVEAASLYNRFPVFKSNAMPSKRPFSQLWTLEDKGRNRLPSGESSCDRRTELSATQLWKPVTDSTGCTCVRTFIDVHCGIASSNIRCYICMPSARSVKFPQVFPLLCIPVNSCCLGPSALPSMTLGRELFNSGPLRSEWHG